MSEKIKSKNKMNQQKLKHRFDKKFIIRKKKIGKSEKTSVNRRLLKTKGLINIYIHIYIYLINLPVPFLREKTYR